MNTEIKETVASMIASTISETIEEINPEKELILDILGKPQEKKKSKVKKTSHTDEIPEFITAAFAMTDSDVHTSPEKEPVTETETAPVTETEIEPKNTQTKESILDILNNIRAKRAEKKEKEKFIQECIEKCERREKEIKIMGIKARIKRLEEDIEKESTTYRELLKYRETLPFDQMKSIDPKLMAINEKKKMFEQILENKRNGLKSQMATI